jgi:hypothetical protein
MTITETVHTGISEDTVGWLLALGEDEFRDVVASDAKSKLDDEVAGALRHPDVLGRWNDTIRVLLANVTAQREIRAGDYSPEVVKWRRKLAWYHEKLVTRRAESRRLLTSHHRGQHDVNVARAEKQLRRVAGENAITRLVQAHPEEFAALLAEEVTAAGDPDTIPERVMLLMDAGMTTRAAFAFAKETWPSGETAPGVTITAAS